MTVIARLVAVLLVGEVFLTFSWASRVASMVVIYDASVLVFVGLRLAVSALQVSAATLLYRRAPAGPLFARWGVGLSSVLLIFEIGFRLSPSSIQPGLRTVVVAGYAVYAIVVIWLLRPDRRTGRPE